MSITSDMDAALTVVSLAAEKQRRALARRMWEAGEHADAIRDAVNRIPGAEQVKSSHAVRTQASHQGWQRPASFIEAKRARYAERMRGMLGRAAATPPEAPAIEAASPVAAETTSPPPAEMAPAVAPVAPAAPTEPTPEEQAAIADAAVANKQERVKESLRDMLARKPRDEFLSAAQIATRHGMPTREVMRLLGEARREREAAA